MIAAILLFSIISEESFVVTPLNLFTAVFNSSLCLHNYRSFFTPKEKLIGGNERRKKKR